VHQHALDKDLVRRGVGLEQVHHLGRELGQFERVQDAKSQPLVLAWAFMRHARATYPAARNREPRLPSAFGAPRDAP
jgi:hypothetical protein